MLVETNGVGDPIYEELRREWGRTTPFQTTNNSKNNIITKLIADIQNLELELPTKELFPALKEELEAFEYQYSKSGNITYSSPTGLHDDTVMSLALANWHRTNRVRKSSIHISKI